MGLTGQFEDERFQTTMQNILKICQQLKKPAGLHVVNLIQSISNLELMKVINYWLIPLMLFLNNQVQIRSNEKCW